MGPRRPTFLGDPSEKTPTSAQFSRLSDPRRTQTPPSGGLATQPPRSSERPPPPPLDAAPPGPSGSYPTPAQELPRQILAALETLKLRGERLAEQARADALEIGFLVARRILEMEMSVSPQPLFALIRSAVRRAGETRKVTVRLCPGDLAKVQGEGKEAVTSLSLAPVELVPDSELSPGDCLVDADLGTVDGRLSTRLAELARAVEESLEEDAA